MSVIEIILIVIGLIFFVGSFFVAEKLSSKDVEKVAELSETELKTVMEKELGEAKARITEIVDDNVDLSINKLKREIDKKTQETLMAIGEYSESVNTELQKANKEATFLYSMLSDRHDEITEINATLNETIAQYKEVTSRPVKLASTAETSFDNLVVKNEITNSDKVLDAPVNNVAVDEKKLAVDSESKAVEATIDEPVSTSDNSPEEINAEVLERYKNGQAIVDIARELKMGQGEVSLIVRLYNSKGEVTDET